jgi:hypothetical protein
MTRVQSPRVTVSSSSFLSPLANYMPVTYNTYMQLGVDGLRGLQNFNTDDQVSCTGDLHVYIRID